MTQRRQFLQATVVGSVASLAGCAGESSANNQSSEEGGNPDADVVLDYSVTASESPEDVPSKITKSRDDGGRRREDHKWVVVSFDVTRGTLDMEDVWFRSRVETDERFYDIDHGSAELADGVQSRGEIKQGASGIALYQIPEDVDAYSWNLEEMRQGVVAEKQ